jgi:hypothetical protein
MHVKDVLPSGHQSNSDFSILYNQSFTGPKYACTDSAK